MKKTVLIDTDIILVELGSRSFQENKNKKDFLLNNPPILGAVEAFKKLNVM